MLEQNETKRPNIENILNRMRDGEEIKESKHKRDKTNPKSKNGGDEEEVKKEDKNPVLKTTKSLNEKDNNKSKDSVIFLEPQDKAKISELDVKKYLKNPNPLNVKKVHLSKAMIDIEALKALSKNISWINLTLLDLSFNSINAAGAALLRTNSLRGQISFH